MLYTYLSQATLRVGRKGVLEFGLGAVRYSGSRLDDITEETARSFPRETTDDDNHF